MADLILVIITTFITCFHEGRLGKEGMQKYPEI